MLIGLTGNIAVGKSSVAQIFNFLGVYKLDADEIVKAFLNRISIQNKRGLLEALNVKESKIYSDGFLDRKKLNNLIFSNPDKKSSLENLLHPLISLHVDCHIKDLEKQGHRIIIYESNLLVETGHYKDMDILIVVIADEALRINRLMDRNSLTKQEAKIIIKSQLPQKEKTKIADFVINNSGSLHELSYKVKNILKEIRKKV
ncbi:MAG: dephospho-CoA kinase [Patescibacteria group bacterium]|jgi:dephospho-CoA kinase